MTDAEREAGAPTAPLDLPLLGRDGNAFLIIGRLRAALKRAGASPEYIEAVTADATSGDYDHVLQVAMREIEASGGTIA